MYRSSLDGLTEQVRALEAEKRRLEADLVGMTRIRLPQRALRVAIALLLLGGSAAVGGVLGYRHAVVSLEAASQRDAQAALWRIQRCNARLSEVLESIPDD